MAVEPERVRVEEIDWSNLFPFVRLFHAFRLAIHPTKFLLALLMVLSLWVGGQILDTIAGKRVLPGEIVVYATKSQNQFDDYVASEKQLVPDENCLGVISAAFEFKINRFNTMVIKATELKFGFGDLLKEGSIGSDSVVGALYDIVVNLPRWFFNMHPWCLLVWCVFSLAVCAFFGGAIARLAASHASRNEHLTMGQSIRFAVGYWPWFFASPLIPLLFALLLGLFMASFGLLFNVEGLDWIGGVLFGLALLFGAIIALLLIGLAAGAPLLFPAIAVEGTDAFDAVSRIYNYVFGRPWRWLFYSLISLVYGAITYLFVGLVIFLALHATRYCVGAWVFRDAAVENLNRFAVIMPLPQLGELTYDIQWSKLNWAGKITLLLVSIWVRLAMGLLAAYAISYYFSSQTWIYLLLRRAADGTEYDDLFVEEAVTEASSAAAVAAPDKVESFSPELESPSATGSFGSNPDKDSPSS